MLHIECLLLAFLFLCFSPLLSLSLSHAVHQASLFGLAGQLPRVYMQAYVVGQSMVGVVGTTFRVITKLAIKSERLSTLIFFSISVCFIMVCVLCHQYMKRSKIIKFYTRSHNSDNSNSSVDGWSSEDGEGMLNSDNHLLLGNPSTVVNDKNTTSTRALSQGEVLSLILTIHSLN